MRRAGNGRWLDGAVIALLLVASLLFQTTDLLGPDRGTEKRSVAVLFAPWVPASAAMQRVADTGARIVALGRLPFIVIAESAEDDFAKKAATTGAVFTLKADLFVACLTSRDAT